VATPLVFAALKAGFRHIAAGGGVTVKLAALELTLPEELVTTQR